MSDLLYILGIVIVIIPIFCKIKEGKRLKKCGYIFIIIVLGAYFIQYKNELNNKNDKLELNRNIISLGRQNDSLIQITSSSELRLCRVEKILEESSKENYEYLIDRYTTGYVLFYGEPKSTYNIAHLVTPHNSKFKKEYKVDYEQVKIIYDEKKNSFTLLMPNLVWVSGDGYAYHANNALGIKLRESYIDRLPYPNISDYVYFEVLQFNKRELIYCIGFRDKKLPKLSYAP